MNVNNRGHIWGTPQASRCIGSKTIDTVVLWQPQTLTQGHDGNRVCILIVKARSCKNHFGTLVTVTLLPPPQPCQVARPLRIRLLPHRKQKSCNCVGIFTNHSTVKMVNSHAEPSLKDKCSMFTGLVEHLGTINSIAQEPPGVRLAIAAGPLAQGVQIGDSICTNGCCLSVIKMPGVRWSFNSVPKRCNAQISVVANQVIT